MKALGMSFAIASEQVYRSLYKPSPKALAESMIIRIGELLYDMATCQFISSHVSRYFRRDEFREFESRWTQAPLQ